MNGLVRKWGNSAAVRIPSGVLAEAGLEVDQPVEIREERGRIIIEAARSVRADIADLVRRIRPDNLHDSIEAGAPVGREVW